MTETLPKQELLKKLLKMTTSSNDGEAIVAMRKANELLTSAGWDWDKLIDGKIRVVEDPFAAMSRPKKAEMAAPPSPPPSAYAQPTRPARTRPAVYYCIDGCGTRVVHPGWQCIACQAKLHTAQAASAAARPATSTFPKIDSSRSNAYGGWCYCCGTNVGSREGFIFDPHTHNPSAPSKWQIACTACNSSRYPNIGQRAAPRKSQQPNWSDVSSNLRDL